MWQKILTELLMDSFPYFFPMFFSLPETLLVGNAVKAKKVGLERGLFFFFLMALYWKSFKLKKTTTTKLWWKKCFLFSQLLEIMSKTLVLESSWACLQTTFLAVFEVFHKEGKKIFERLDLMISDWKLIDYYFAIKLMLGKSLFANVYNFFFLQCNSFIYIPSSIRPQDSNPRPLDC